MIESTRSFGPLRVSEVSGKSYGRDRPAWLIRRPAIDQNSGRNKLIDDLNPFSSCRDFLASFRDLWAGQYSATGKGSTGGLSVRWRSRNRITASSLSRGEVGRPWPYGR